MGAFRNTIEKKCILNSQVPSVDSEAPMRDEKVGPGGVAYWERQMQPRLVLREMATSPTQDMQIEYDRRSDLVDRSAGQTPIDDRLRGWGCCFVWFCNHRIELLNNV